VETCFNVQIVMTAQVTMILAICLIKKGQLHLREGALRSTSAQAVSASRELCEMDYRNRPLTHPEGRKSFTMGVLRGSNARYVYEKLAITQVHCCAERLSSCFNEFPVSLFMIPALEMLPTSMRITMYDQ
jgi:hypothetical protein